MKTFYIRYILDNYTSEFREVIGTPLVNPFNLDLFTHKTVQGMGKWTVSDNRTGQFLAANGDTRAEVNARALERLEECKEWIVDAIHNARVVSPAYGGDVKVEWKVEKYEDEFYSIFSIPLRHYWDFIMGIDCGFDVIKFDSFINPPDGVSCAETVRSKYGERALQLVNDIMA